MECENMQRVKRIADDAQMKFHAQFGRVTHARSAEDIARRRRLEDEGKFVYAVVLRAAMAQELHDLDQSLKKLKDEEKDLMKQEEEALHKCSEAEISAKIKDLELKGEEYDLEIDSDTLAEVRAALAKLEIDELDSDDGNTA